MLKIYKVIYNNGYPQNNYSLLKFLVTIASNLLIDSPSNCTRCGLFRNQMMHTVMHTIPRVPVVTPIPYIHGFTKQTNKMKSTIVLKLFYNSMKINPALLSEKNKNTNKLTKMAVVVVPFTRVVAIMVNKRVVIDGWVF